MRTVLLCVLAPLIFIVTVVSADDDSPRNGGQREIGNAALAYWQARECLLALIPDVSDPSTAVARFKIIGDGHKAPLNEDATEAIRGTAMALCFLRRGARIEKCDWGLALDELGPADEQGHLAQMPLLVGAACLRARYYFEQDMSQEAVGDLIAVLRLAEHAGNRGHDGTRALISQLSTETRAIDIAARWLPQMEPADAQRLGLQMTGLPIPEILKNFLAAQKKQWVDWPRKFARHARNHDGDWDSYWVTVGMRADYRAEVGNLLRDASNGNPDRLLSLANDAADVLQRARSLADLPPEEFRPAWRSLLNNSAEENLIVKLAGGEVEPILDALFLVEERRALFRAGVVVARNGPAMLKDLQSPCGAREPQWLGTKSTKR
jgi:hypothetical protein